LNYNDMTRTVAGRTGLTKRRSDEVLVATLTVLSEVISAGETNDMLAQLPKSLRNRIPVSGETLEMRPIEFVARVADLVEPATIDEAEGYVHAVFATLAEAVNAGEMRDVAEELGPEFSDLIGRPVPPREPESRMEPVSTSQPLPTPSGSSIIVDVLVVAVGGLIKVPVALIGRLARLLPTGVTSVGSGR
jgi:uncharacterized protein (DUF2267 family)